MAHNGKLIYSVKLCQETVKVVQRSPKQFLSTFRFDEPLSEPCILKDEVQCAVNYAKINKATGPDEILVEALKALVEDGFVLVHHQFSHIYKTGNIPEGMLKSGAMECENFRTISVMRHLLKSLFIVVVQRMRKKTHGSINKEHFGFKPDRGYRYAIRCFRVLGERLLNH